MKRILFIGILLILTAQIVLAQTFSVQGVLRDPLGKTVDDGSYSVTFRLYEQATGGTAVWSETQGSVEVLHGVFNVELGIVTSLSDTPFDTTYWLGISIEGGTELEPRFKLLKTPSALSVLGTDNVFPSKGNIGSGTLNPTAGLHIVTQSANTDLLKIESSGTSGNIVVNADGKMTVTQDSLVSEALEIYGNLNIKTGHAIKFSDGSRIYSANFGGSATSIASPSHAEITADAEGGGTGEIQFFVYEDQKMVIDHDGNVGIGTASPSNPLTVSGNADFTNSVGIGTTDPEAKLHIAGGVKIDSVYTLEFGAGIAGKEASAGKIGYQTWTADALDIVGAGTEGNRKIKFWNEGGASFSGNVGIGTDSPALRLQVQGNESMPTTGGNSTSGHLRLSGGDLTLDLGTNASAGSWSGWLQTMAISNSDPYPLILNPLGGNVGIGTTDPGAKLHVYGSATPDMIIEETGSEAAAQLGLKNTVRHWLVQADADPDQFYISDWTSDIHKLMIPGGNTNKSSVIIPEKDGAYVSDWPSGWAGGLATYDINAASIQYSGLQQRSDRRLKKNIRYLDKKEGLEIIDKLKGVSFEWKEGKGECGTQFGFIAQDVEKVMPYLVRENTEGYKSLNTEGILPFAVEAIKELKAEVEGLQAENASLKAELNTLNEQFASDLKRLEAMMVSTNQNSKGRVVGDEDGLAVAIVGE